MAFKMKGFNPGKGTGMGQGFPNNHVVLNPNTRDAPNAAEYIEWYTKNMVVLLLWVILKAWVELQLMVKRVKI